MRNIMLLGLMPLAGCVSVTERMREAAPADIARTYTAPTAAYARTLVIPAGYETIRLPGIIPDAISGSDFGDTERQTENALAKIKTQLAEAGATEADVVAATV